MFGWDRPCLFLHIKMMGPGWDGGDCEAKAMWDIADPKGKVPWTQLW